ALRAGPDEGDTQDTHFSAATSPDEWVSFELARSDGWVSFEWPRFEWPRWFEAGAGGRRPSLMSFSRMGPRRYGRRMRAAWIVLLLVSSVALAQPPCPGDCDGDGAVTADEAARALSAVFDLDGAACA